MNKNKNYRPEEKKIRQVKEKDAFSNTTKYKHKIFESEFEEDEDSEYEYSDQHD